MLTAYADGSSNFVGCFYRDEKRNVRGKNHVRFVCCRRREEEGLAADG